jgi:two-component system, chemotaxis family, sensor kinase CheA
MNNEFFQRLLATFKIEAQEHIQALSARLLELENHPSPDSQAQILETIFREAHSLKGAARSVHAQRIENICQSLENLFTKLTGGDLTLSQPDFDLLHSAVDLLDQSLSALDSPAPSLDPRISQLLEDLRNRTQSESLPPPQPQHAPSQPAPPPPTPFKTLPPALVPEETISPGTVRVPVQRLDAVLYQAEEMIAFRQSAQQRLSDLLDFQNNFSTWKKEWRTIRPELRLAQAELLPDRTDPIQGNELQLLARILEFMQLNSEYLEKLELELRGLVRNTEQDQHTLTRRVDHLLHETKEMLMLPFSSYVELFPKLVRDLSRDQGKEVQLIIQGGQHAMDRRIFEEMKNPFIHLLRNSVDHGIELPQERIRLNKPTQGTIYLSVSPRNDGRLEVVISDDGAGMDAAEVKSAVVQAGLLSQAEADKLTDSQILALVFESQVSTSKQVTEVSGRGLGLAIVREKVEKLGGTLTLETDLHAGATFRIRLPMTLAQFRGVLVRAADQLFILPTPQVERVLRVHPREIKTVENRATVQLRDETVKLSHLADLLGIPRTGRADFPDALVPVMILSSRGRRIALQLDEILREEEVLMKPLGKLLVRVRNVAGATQLGTGQVVPILHLNDLVHVALLHAETPVTALSKPVPAFRKKSILIAEDSITSRTLLRNILQSAGYHVETSVDGYDAFTALKTKEFDLLVSDVDMPRMNGFDLTARIRSEPNLNHLPVILVTALASRDDKERGIDSGANAYIVKSSFDQSDLLEAVSRLL